MVASSAQKTYRNSLLSCLPARELKQLQPHLRPVVLRRNHTLLNAGQAVKTVYFLEDGVCSIVAGMQNGASVEVGIIGRDGFVGTSAILGAPRSPNRNFIQIAGHGFAIDAKVLVELSADAGGELRRCLHRGIQGLMMQTAQTAACNRVHELEERLARWLLMCRDRMQKDDLHVTHEFLANMLGTRRSTVTVAAGMLQKAGLIDYMRGRVQIVDRKGLERASCECYQTVHEEYVRLGLL